VRELEEMVGDYARGEELAAQLAVLGQSAGLARLATAVAGARQPAFPVDTALPLLSNGSAE